MKWLLFRPVDALLWMGADAAVTVKQLLEFEKLLHVLDQWMPQVQMPSGRVGVKEVRSREMVGLCQHPSDAVLPSPPRGPKFQLPVTLVAGVRVA